MAGDWLKIQVATPDKPEVHALAAALGIDADAVFGKCFRVWAWFDAQTEDGNAHGVTKTLIDRITSVAGFADAMASVGWLHDTADGLRLPHFDRHNGKTAKTRALTAVRVDRLRNASRNDDVTPRALPREEKRREENKKPTPSIGRKKEDDAFIKGLEGQSPFEEAAARRGNGVAYAKQQ